MPVVLALHSVCAALGKPLPELLAFGSSYEADECAVCNPSRAHSRRASLRRLVDHSVGAAPRENIRRGHERLSPMPSASRRARRHPRPRRNPPHAQLPRRACQGPNRKRCAHAHARSRAGVALRAAMAPPHPKPSNSLRVAETQITLSRMRPIKSSPTGALPSGSRWRFLRSTRRRPRSCRHSRESRRFVRFAVEFSRAGRPGTSLFSTLAIAASRW